MPFTYTRPVADIRVGILTIQEKNGSHILDYTTTTVTEDYLSDKFPMVEMEENIMINASFFPNSEVVEMVKNLEDNQAFLKERMLLHFLQKKEKKTVILAHLKLLNMKVIF